MDHQFDLRDFSNICRLFPLREVVHFPHAVLPLHIFEPRYRQMTEDALADDKLVTMVQLRPQGPGKVLGSPAIAEVACLGQILQHERLPDGRFNFLLLGRKRVRLIREIPSNKLYRLAEAEVLDDREDELPEEPCRDELIALFRRVFQRGREIDPDLGALLETALPLSVLTDIIAHALGLPSEIKQNLLAETNVARRVSHLRKILEQVADQSARSVHEPHPFPPPFSIN
jgi:Lon protease-like protein